MVSDVPITADVLTDFIGVVVDHLDDAGLIPNVSTAGIGDDVVKLVVEVVIEGEPLEAFTAGVAAIAEAFTAAGFADAVGAAAEATIRPLAAA